MPDDFYERPAPALAPPLAISHIVRTLRTYLPVIALSLAAVMVGYLIVAVAVYVLSPSQAVTSLRFRIDFKGADLGQYPNGTKFSSTEIITTPVLLRAYEANDLGRFTTFADFTKSIFVLESNTAHDTLSLEYQSRMSDPKLMPVDRDRLQREYESKLASLSKDQYSLNYLRPSRMKNVPEAIARKVLHDILREWAEFVSKEQHVLEYRVALLSPSAIAATRVDAQTDPIIATQVLRAHIMRVQANIQSMRRIPAADLIHTRKEGLTLVDVATRLEDIMRFRLGPLVESIAGSNLLNDRAATIRFLETQLDYDRRYYDAQKQKVEAVRQALSLYMNGRGIGSQFVNGNPTAPPAESTGPNETVMPQLSESFLERVIQMTTNTTEIAYRKSLTEDYRQAALDAIPTQQAVAYDQAVLDIVRGTSGGATLSRDLVNQQLTATREEVRQIVMQLHEIHAAVSRNMNPSTELLSLIGVPATRLERSVSIKMLALYGILTCFIAIPIIVVLCLLHNRVREEEAAEATITSVPNAVESTG
ncbi:MAG: hypothetical protein M3P06_23025 [Acidobacteriota bacterium]|nr:hypothetical protein [Acidobacteriota bacterium]